MHCLYCKTKSSSQFCSQEHKKRFYDNIDNAIQTHCPSIISKDLSEKEKEMQRAWKAKI